MTAQRFPDSFAAASAADTTLAAGINSSVTALSVTTLPAGVSAAPFACKIGSEIMEVTALSGGGSLSWTVTRGYAGTTAASHSTSDDVFLVVVEEDFVRVTDGRNISPLDVTLTEETTPATPDTGLQTIFLDDADHHLKRVDETGTVTDIESGGMTNPMTTQDDLIVGGASGTPARLAKGSDGQVLTVDPTTHHLVWATPGAGSSPLTTKGDLYGHTTVDARVPVGTDGDVLTADSGAALGVSWQAPSGGGGSGDWVRIASLIPTGTNADFTSIPATYRHLRIVWIAQGTDAATQVISLQFNADTGSNYDYFRQFSNSGGYTAANDGNGVTSAECGVATKTGLTGYVCQGEIMVNCYRDTTFYKSFKASTAYIEAASAGNMYRHDSAGWWRNTGAINEIKLTLAAGNFASGSRFDLYGQV
jgi:hypothetical protein